MGQTLFSWPVAADAAAADRLVERFAALGAPHAACASGGDGLLLLRAVGGGSPYLSDLVVREAACVLAVLREGPEGVVELALAALRGTGAGGTRAQVMAAMRRAKRQVALVTALADIGGVWGLNRVTAALSDLAEGVLRLAVDHLLLAAARAGQIRVADAARPGAGSGFVVLGMGKLGARELNYSSDVDLVLLYDPDTHSDPDTLGATFTRIARALVGMMETRDADGYVFRTDLRLRPDPAATPPAVSLPAALSYYETMGETWERAAMLKARPVAGDLACGAAFLSAIEPFVWRRHLDFAAIADLHAMKRRIDSHRGFAPAAADDTGIAGWNVKLGPGGIREVEFAVQTLQLVWAGRDAGLRDRTTLGAVRRLVRARHLARRAGAGLTVAYRQLRRIEHRLQMVSDRQTHEIPTATAEVEQFARFFGCRDRATFEAMAAGQRAVISAQYQAVFATVPLPPGPLPALDLGGKRLPETALARLSALGFRNTAGIGETLRGWRAGRLRAVRSARARALLDEMLVPVLTELGRQADPDAAFFRFDAMLSRLPAGVQVLSMFQRVPALLGRIADVLGAAPMLADHLVRVPSALEGLLEPAAPIASAPADVLAARLMGAGTLEEVIRATSRFVRAEEFRLGVAQMEGVIDVDTAGLERSAVADAALRAVLPAVLAEHGRRYGVVRGGDMAVVALGKAGSCEMMAGSDLDLMLLYSYPAQSVASVGGPRSVAASQWFIRAAHAFVAALTAPGPEGPLYTVDMRLRPSGNKGPVAVPLAGFARYQREAAWTWERMALTRARVVAGRPAICGRAARAIGAALSAPADAARVLADAADMRKRLLAGLPASGRWDTKMRAGGGMEVEFVAQALQLVHGVRPGRQRTVDALAGLAADGVLDGEEAAVLIRADRLWRTVQSMVRLTVGRSDGDLPAAAAAAVLAAAGRVVGRSLDLPGLDATLDDTAHAVRRIFNQRIGAIG